jgi:sulfur carrier protein
MGEQGPERIRIVLNGEERLVRAGTSLEALVQALGMGRRGVAVALEGEVVPRSEWASCTVEAGNRVEIVAAAAGG